MNDQEMPSGSRLLAAFSSYQSQRSQLESRFLSDMQRLEGDLSLFIEDIRRKIQDTSECAEGKKEQLQEIAQHAERLMAALRSKTARG